MAGQPFVIELPNKIRQLLVSNNGQAEYFLNKHRLVEASYDGCLVVCMVTYIEAK